MALHQIPANAVNVRGVLAELYAQPGAEFALAYILTNAKDGMPMRITRGNFDLLNTRRALNQRVIAYCDGQGLWTVQLERKSR